MDVVLLKTQGRQKCFFPSEDRVREGATEMHLRWGLRKGLPDQAKQPSVWDLTRPMAVYSKNPPQSLLLSSGFPGGLERGM